MGRRWVRASGPHLAYSDRYWERSRNSGLTPGAKFLLRMATSLGCLIALSQVTAFGYDRCLRLDKGLPGINVIHGRFTHGKPRAAYCLYAHAGQHVLIDIKPSANLDTQGYLRFAGTPAKPDWAPGSPGGIVFNEAVPWAGKYWLVVGQRFNERRAGRFEIEISGN